MQKQQIPRLIRTRYPHPTHSPDYYNPAGSIEDNHTHPYFIMEVDKGFDYYPYSLLDIGCAGGQLVVDIYNKGEPWFAAGVEGGNIYTMTEELPEVHHGCTGPITIAAGSKNWKEYKDKCLFHADVTKPFDIINPSTGQRQMFNIVTSYEFFEHPLPEEIPAIIENIKKHMMPGATLIGTLNMSPGEHHRCVKTIEEWNELFQSHGFETQTYPFCTTPRTSNEGLSQILHNRIAQEDRGIREGHPEYRRLHDQSAGLDPDINPDHYPFAYYLPMETE